MYSLKETVIMAILGTTILGIIIVALMVGMPFYKVWAQEMRGKAALAEATQSKMISIETAKAELESAELRAKAIQIVGQSAKDYPEYRQQEFIGAFGEALRDGKIEQIIYVPTEANLPILEAGKFNKQGD